MLKKILLAFILFFLFPGQVFAQVVINEFSSNSNPEWVELYNDSGQIIDLRGWKIIDGNQSESDDLSLDGCLISKGFRSFSRAAGWLNDTGDDIILKNSTNEQVDKVVYGNDTIVGIPPKEKSAGRNPAGTSSWQIFDSPSPMNNDCQLISPTPTLISSPTLAPTPTSTPRLTPTPTSKPMATYKINEVKDEDGEILNNVKVYVDDVYLHHYVPEVLTFCDDCQCDGYVVCGFGQHLIKLEKTGYHDWNETKIINPNTNDEVNPIMIFSDSTSVPTPTPTSRPTSIPTPKQTIVPSLTPKPTVKIASSSGEVLGELGATLSAFYPYEATNGAEENEAISSVRNKLWPKIFLGVGLLLVFASVFWGWYNFHK